MTNDRVTALRVYQFTKRIPDENAARKYFEEMRWPKGRYCPHCKSKNTVEVLNEKPQPYRCKDCRKHFSVRTGTVLAASNVPLQKWLLAADLMRTAKMGISSSQMAKALGVTQKTAWQLCHKITEIWTMSDSPFVKAVKPANPYMDLREKNKTLVKRLQTHHITSRKTRERNHA